jgi:hypothetical protein
MKAWTTGGGGGSGGTGTPTPSVFVYRPGGTPSANVFVTQAALDAAVALTQGPVIIEIDDSVVSPAVLTTPSPAWRPAKVRNVTLVGYGSQSGATFPIVSLTGTLNSVGVYDTLDITLSGGAAAAILAANEVAIITFRGNVLINTPAAVPFIDATANGANIAIYWEDTCEIGIGNLLASVSAGSVGQVVALDYAQIGNNTLKGPAASWAVDLTAGALFNANAQNNVTPGVIVPTWHGGGGSIIGTYAGRPAPAQQGRRYVCTDGSPVEFLDDGTLWRPLIDGTLGVETAPANSIAALTQVNFQAGTAASGVGGCAIITAAGNGAGVHNLQGLERAFAFGQTALVCLKPWNNFKTQNVWFWGIYLHDTVGGTCESLALGTDTDQNAGLPFGAIGNKIDRITWTAPGTVLANPLEDITYFGSGERIWLRLRSHGPNQAGASIEGAYSTDGKNFVIYYDVAIATAFNRAGFFADPLIVTPGGAPVNITAESFSIL